MKSKFIAIVFSLFTVTLFADSAERIIFDATMRRVDTGGEFVLYQNFNSINIELQKLIPETVSKLMELIGNKKDAKFLSDLTATVLNTLNLQAMQSCAVSSKEYPPGIFVTKSVAYYGNNLSQPGIHNILDRVNRPLNWQNLPAGTRIALRTRLHPGRFLTDFTRNCRANSNPDVKALPESFAEYEAIIRSLDGYLTFIICAPTQPAAQWQIMLELPDAHGVIAKMLQESFPVQPGTNSASLNIALPMLAELKLTYTGKSVRLGPDLIAKRHQHTLGSQPHIQLLANHLPANGTEYFIWDMDEATATIINLLTQQYGLNILKKSTLISTTAAHQDGFSSVMASDFSILKTLQTLPATIYTRSLLPALERSRMRAKTVSCANNLKQLAVALALYHDNHGKFPAPNGRAGLQVLADNKLIKADCFSCPANNTKDGSGAKSCYIYIGSGISLAKITNAATLPVLFDAPGCNHGDIVNVAFADGHVASLKVPDYSEPSQVIGVLIQKNKYPPELLNQLLKAVSESR